MPCRWSAPKAGRVASPRRPRFCDEWPWSSGPLGDRTLPGADEIPEQAQHPKQSLVADFGVSSVERYAASG